MKDPENTDTPTIAETAIAAGMVVEGKIQGSTNLRIAGTFKGDLTVQGTLVLDHGGLIVGNVSAKSVVLGGEIQGNIIAAARVAILGSGVLRGDLKAQLFVAEAGAQMCGRAEFGGQN
jgi:cytoskeletal protein CcmA (bactofilin family)